MRIKLFIIISLLLTATIPVFSIKGFCSPKPHEAQLEATEAAVEGLPIFLEAIPLQELDRFNFNSPQELNRATLGEPFRIFTITTQDILSYDGQTQIGELITAIDIWYFPVMVEGRARTLLGVEKTGGVWKAASIGSSQLAEEWSRVQETYPTQLGFQKKFVRIYQATSDFVLLDQPQESSVLLPLRSAGIALGLEHRKPHSPKDVLMEMKETVLRNLEM